MRSILLLAVLMLVVGCKPTEVKEAAVPLDEVPENVMQVANEKLPDVTFDRAVRKHNGRYEILGKGKDGKDREIVITPSGEVTRTDK